VTGSERDFRALIEASPDGVAVVRDGIYLYVNPAFAALLDRPVESMEGRSLFDDVEEGDRSALEERLLVHGDDDDLGDFRFRNRGGERVTVQLRPVAVEEFGGGPCTVVTARDVTERRKLQARLLLVDRLMSVGSLAAGVAHEINNPLSYVMGNLAFMREELQKREAGELLEAARDAEQGAERVRRIVKNLQEFSRADQEGTSALDLNRSIEAAIGMAWIEIRHRAQLVRDLGPDLPPVLANEAKLGQVVVNLLLNAAHALPEGEADKHRISIRTSLEGDRVLMEISDTGPGIPPEIVDRVFDTFFTTKPIGIGTGLGLSIVHSIVTDLEGEIGVDSKLGEGTTFRVRLPTAKARETAAPARSVVGYAANLRGKLLLVDDEPLIANSLRRALKEHDVTVVRSGRRAIEVLKEAGDFDLIFCDLMMPDLTGMDVHAWVKEHRPGLEQRMVFMTGGIFTPRVQAFLHEVENHRIQKPFDLDRIRRFVESTVSRGRVPTDDLP
jgi:two-component system, cell cycle sensor histidine kinase and response regulator CckA